jgi:hypothetical protein
MPRGIHNSDRGRPRSGRESTSINLTPQEKALAKLLGNGVGDGVRSLIGAIEWMDEVYTFLDGMAHTGNVQAQDLLERFPVPGFEEAIDRGKQLGVIEVKNADGEISAWIV